MERFYFEPWMMNLHLSPQYLEQEERILSSRKSNENMITVGQKVIGSKGFHKLFPQLVVERGHAPNFSSRKV